MCGVQHRSILLQAGRAMYDRSRFLPPNSIVSRDQRRQRQMLLPQVEGSTTSNGILRSRHKISTRPAYDER
jgi:hypothetical protein